MIKKTIIIAFALFVAYNLFLGLVHPFPGHGQNQWQKNRILIEDYADSKKPYDVVIVGTSLSARLYSNLLAEGYYNLGLAGEGIFDGLNTVINSPQKPHYVLIETNIYNKEADKELSEGIFNPQMMLLRKWLPSFREENQPANLLASPFVKGGPIKALRSKIDTSIINNFVRNRIKEDQTLPDTNLARRCIDTLQKDIVILHDQGVKVIFYEMPVHCKIYGTPRYNALKGMFTRSFPSGPYTWMPPADCSAYQYDDGLHMDYESSGKFVDWFVKAFNRVR